MRRGATKSEDVIYMDRDNEVNTGEAGEGGKASAEAEDGDGV